MDASDKAKVFVPGEPFQPSVIFTSEATITYLHIANIRLGWKGLAGTNTLAYLAHSRGKKKKSFVTLAPVACTINVYDRKLHLSLERNYDHTIVILAMAI